MNKYVMARAWAVDQVNNFQNSSTLKHIWDNHFGLTREMLMSRITLDGRMESTMFEAKNFSDIEGDVIDALCDYFEDIQEWMRRGTEKVSMAFNWEAESQIGHGYKKLRSGKIIFVKCFSIRIALKKGRYGNVYIDSVYPIE